MLVSPRRRPPLDLVVIAAVAVVIGGLCLWQLYEYDVFWQLRMGFELLHFRDIRFDRWSYTVTHQRWYPVHWLSYVLFAAVAKLGGYAGLCLLRSLIVTGWMMAGGVLLRRSTAQGPTRGMILVLGGLWMFLSCHWEIMLRPDLIALLLFSLLLLVLSARVSPVRKALLGTAVLWGWANFHGGIYPIGLCVFVVGILTDRGLRWGPRAAWIGASFVVWIATPMGTSVVSGLIGNTFLYGERMRAVADPLMLPFSIRLLRFGVRGWAYRLWLGYGALATLGLAWMVARDRLGRLPGAYANRAFTVSLWIILTAMTFRYVRMIAFHVTFALPLVGGCLSEWIAVAWTGSRNQRLAIVSAWLVVVGFAGGRIIPDDWFRVSGRPLGLGVSSSALPILTVRFLNRYRPAGQIFHHMDWGGLLLVEAPEYPVALDGRNLVFTPVLETLVSTLGSRSTYGALLKRWNVNTVMEKIGFLTSDRLAALYDPSEWAEVFFDNTAILYVRRIPEHARLIGEFEYKRLRREVPFAMARSHASTKDAFRELVAEIRRCLNQDPENAYCRFAEAKVFEETHDLTGALSDLRIAQKAVPWDRQVLDEQVQVLTRLNRLPEADTLRASIRRLEN